MPVFAREASGESSYAQIKAFTDTWEWTSSGAETAYNEFQTIVTPITAIASVVDASNARVPTSRPRKPA